MVIRKIRGVLSICATLVLIMGVYEPFIRVNPTLPPERAVPARYLERVLSGISILEGVLALLVAVGVGMQVALWIGERQDRIAEGTFGCALICMCGGYLLWNPFFGFNSIFVPATGFYLVLVSGILFITTTLIRLLRNK